MEMKLESHPISLFLHWDRPTRRVEEQDRAETMSVVTSLFVHGLQVFLGCWNEMIRAGGWLDDGCVMPFGVNSAWEWMRWSLHKTGHFIAPKKNNVYIHTYHTNTPAIKTLLRNEGENKCCEKSNNCHWWTHMNIKMAWHNKKQWTQMNEWKDVRSVTLWLIYLLHYSSLETEGTLQYVKRIYVHSHTFYVQKVIYMRTYHCCCYYKVICISSSWSKSIHRAAGDCRLSLLLSPPSPPPPPWSVILVASCSKLRTRRVQCGDRCSWWRNQRHDGCVARIRLAVHTLWWCHWWWYLM